MSQLIPSPAGQQPLEQATGQQLILRSPSNNNIQSPLLLQVRNYTRSYLFLDFNEFRFPAKLECYTYRKLAYVWSKMGTFQ